MANLQEDIVNSNLFQWLSCHGHMPLSNDKYIQLLLMKKVWNLEFTLLNKEILETIQKHENLETISHQ